MQSEITCVQNGLGSEEGPPGELQCTYCGIERLLYGAAAIVTLVAARLHTMSSTPSPMFSHMVL